MKKVLALLNRAQRPPYGLCARFSDRAQRPPYGLCALFSHRAQRPPYGLWARFSARNGYRRACVVVALVAGAYFAGRADISRDVKLENGRVRVIEMDYKPGVPRARSIRPADQVIVFLDDSRYERLDPDTGEKTVRTRKSGDVIWHNKGEVSPQLTNLGSRTYRTIVVELK